MVRKEFFFLVVQFLLFATYFIDIQYIEASLPLWLQYALIVPIVVAALVIFFGIFHLNDNLSYEDPAGKKVVFVFKGIYNYIRHPVYLGIILGMASYALMVVSIFKLLVTILLTVVFYWKSNYEEKWLLKRYEHFREYKDRTGRFFPKINNRQR